MSSWSDDRSVSPNLSQILFSFDGRIPRSTYWLASIGLSLFSAVIVTVVLGGIIAITDNLELANIALLVLYFPIGYVIELGLLEGNLHKNDYGPAIY